MAGIQILNAAGQPIGGQEAARQPMQVAIMPPGGPSYRFAGFTGTIAAATSANSEVLQFRFSSGTKSFALVERIDFSGMGIVAVATAAGPLGFQIYVARAWTGIGSGGTRIIPAADNLQLETISPNSQVNDIGIATTGALTGGTKTLDGNAIGQAIGGIGTGAVTTYGQTSVVLPQTMFNFADSGMPLVLANNEGFVIRTTHNGPAGLTYAAGFMVQWREVTAF